MKLMVTTQVYENYGSSMVPHWKAKGGETYCVARISYSEAAELGYSGLSVLVNDLSKKHGIVVNAFEDDDCNYEEYVIDWSLEEDDFITYDEKLQLEFDGKITYHHKYFSLKVLA
jgi:hypothetical protein